MGSKVEFPSFVAGFTAACALAGGLLVASDFIITTKSSIISKKELDEGYIPKSNLDKLYISKSYLDSRYTKNEDIVEKYIDKSIVKKSYVSKGDYERLREKYKELTSTLYGIPKPFTPLKPQLEHISSWRDEKLGVALKIYSHSWTEAKGSAFAFYIKLPNRDVETVKLKDSNYQNFRPRFDVNNRIFEIRLIDIKNKIFEISEIVEKV